MGFAFHSVNISKRSYIIILFYNLISFFIANCLSCFFQCIYAKIHLNEYIRLTIAYIMSLYTNDNISYHLKWIALNSESHNWQEQSRIWVENSYFDKNFFSDLKLRLNNLLCLNSLVLLQMKYKLKRRAYYNAVTSYMDNRNSHQRY